MPLLLLLIYSVIGAIAGLLAGLLGISGGVVTIPLLLWTFTALDFPQENLMQLVIGTSLAAMAFNALSSTWSHHARGTVLWGVVRKFLPGLLLGCLAGALIARFLPDEVLQMSFGIFGCLLALSFFRKMKPHTGEHKLPKGPALGFIGLGIGIISSILGIGGGVISVPTLMAFKVNFPKAVGTSAATGLFISIVGAISYLLFGMGQTAYPDSVGFVYFPAFIMISITSVLTAPFGAKLTHVIPVAISRRIFAIALFAVGLRMMLM